MNCPTYYCAGDSPDFHIKAYLPYEEVMSVRYVCDKLSSSLNDVKYSNAVVSEFMN